LTTKRDQKLEALATVLREIEGVRYVSRQGITRQRVTDADIPSIAIEEQRTQFIVLQRIGKRRVVEVRDTLVLELRTREERNEGREGNHSTKRDAFQNAVLGLLWGNPTLVCQLEGESEPTAHAKDVAGPSDPESRYLPTSTGSTSALLTIVASHEDVFDESTYTAWLSASFTAYARDEVGEDDSARPEINVDLT